MNSTEPPNLNDTPDLNSPGEEGQVELPKQVQVDCAAATHPGNVRSHNEDHYLVARFGRSLETMRTNLPAGLAPQLFEEIGYGLAVADGVGGAAAGEIASAMAIHAMLDLVLNTPDWIFSTGPPEAERVMQRMAERYRQVNATLLEKALADPSLTGMGTTMTLACSVGSRLILAHVGDSRAYLWRGGSLHQLTRDHTVAQTLVDLGILRDPKEASQRSHQILTRVLGGRGGPADAEVQHLPMQHGDGLLLCTDGLTDMVDNNHLVEFLREERTVQETCDALIAAALRNGGKDNVTVVLARYAFTT